MARRRPAVEAAPDEVAGSPILPAELLRRDGLDRSESATMDKERDRWLRDHGVDPADWSVVHSILIASGRAHGIPSGSLDRAWVRSIGLEEWRRIQRTRQERER